MKDNLAIVITGPTASGKSALAVELARRLDTEIISADSRQVFRGIPVVTAVPTIEERGGVSHHLLEILDLNGYYSAALFEQDGLEISNGLLRQGKTPIICGGSMLYIDSFCNGIDELPTVPEDIRQDLMQLWKNNGNEWLIDKLKKTDPSYWEIVDKNNLKRIFHAIEVSVTAGEPYSKLLNRQKKERPFQIIKIGLTGNRDRLFERINSRVLTMLKNGLEEEAMRVYPLRHLNSLNTVGLKEMFSWFEGGFATREEAVARIQKNTRVYAKKQLTWHKRDSEIFWLDFEESPKKNSEKILERIFSGHNLY